MTTVWIYHERQDALLCGQHALNNLVQACVFSPDSLSEIAHQLDEMELTYMAQNTEGGTSSRDYLNRVAEGSGNVDPSGNFSIEVLRAALSNTYGLALPNVRQEGVMSGRDVADIDGFICNRDSHWFAIRRINGRYWNLNSTLDRPEQISHFRLAAEIQALQDSGYSVFCVVDAELPPECTSSAQRERGLPQYWWKEEDLVKGKSNATTGATDPWRNAGGGMRLDGKALGNRASRDGGGASAASDPVSAARLGGLSEEEMMRMAVEASLETEVKRATSTTSGVDEGATADSDLAIGKCQVPPEPEPTNPDAVRLQFRLPGGERVIRRFLKTDSVGVLYAFAREHGAGEGGERRKRLEMRAGFPPKDLASKAGESIEEAKLAGDSIQCRYV